MHLRTERRPVESKEQGIPIRCPAAEDGDRLCKVLRALQRIWAFTLKASGKGESGRGGEEKNKSSATLGKYHCG